LKRAASPFSFYLLVFVALNLRLVHKYAQVNETQWLKTLSISATS
jgi:hypothetical protein